MNVRVLFVLLLSASIPFSAHMSAAAPTGTTISISVRNQFDKPVENAAVILDFIGSHQIAKLGKRKTTHWEVHTNMHGEAHFPPVPMGTVQLQVIKKEYQTFGDKFDLDTPDKKIDIKMSPPQKQYSVHGPLKPADTEPAKSTEPRPSGSGV